LGKGEIGNLEGWKLGDREPGGMETWQGIRRYESLKVEKL